MYVLSFSFSRVHMLRRTRGQQEHAVESESESFSERIPPLTRSCNGRFKVTEDGETIAK